MLILFCIFLKSSNSSYQRKFPYIPVFVQHGEAKIVDFFEMNHSNQRLSTIRVIKSCFEKMKNESNVLLCLRKINKLVEDGDGDSAFIMGTINEYGLFKQPMNDTKARKYYEIGSYSGHSECQSSLGFMLRYGIGGSADIPRALVLTHIAASKNSITAKLTLSFMYRFGLNVPQSCSTGYQVLDTLSLAIQKGINFDRLTMNPGVSRIFPGKFPTDITRRKISISAYHKSSSSAAENLLNGYKYLFGKKPEYDKAESLLKLSGGEGVGFAFGLLGKMYIDGIGVDSDPQIALGFFSKGIEHGDTLSMTEAAKYYLEKNISEEVVKQAKLVLISAASQNDPMALHDLGLRYLKGYPPFEYNIGSGLNYINQAADLSHLPSIFLISKLIYSGVSAVQDCNESLRLLTLATELSFIFDDSRRAWNAVAKEDHFFALRKYQRLADWGSEASMWNSEKLCEFLKLDPTPWFDLQVKMGFHTALQKLGEKQLDEGNEEKAKDTWRKASDKESRAAFSLGISEKWKPKEALKYIGKSLELQKDAFIAVRIAQIYISLINTPRGIYDFILNKSSQQRDLFVSTLKTYTHTFLLSILFISLYVFVRRRVSTWVPV